MMGQDAPPVGRQPRLITKVTILAYENGGVSLDGPYDDPVLFLGVLELAKALVVKKTMDRTTQQPQQQTKKIVLPQPLIDELCAGHDLEEATAAAAIPEEAPTATDG